MSRLTEAALLPLQLGVEAVERYRLDQRVYDLLRTDDGTVTFIPSVSYSGGDGIGVGGSLDIEPGRGAQTALELGGELRPNGDRDIEGYFQRAIAMLEGRRIMLHGIRELDTDDPYYGIGGDTANVENVLRRELFAGSVAVDVGARGERLTTGAIRIGARREELGPGEEEGKPAVGTPAASAEPPPGFTDAITYAQAGALVRHDTRDTPGRPTHGILAELDGSLAADVHGLDLASAGARARLSWYVPVLARRRVLVLSAGLGATVPLTPQSEVPYHELVTLGRNRHLRGYGKARFRDRLGWWASAEYRYPIYEFMTTNAALRASLFVDAGRVGSSLGELANTPVRYDGGVRFTIAHTTTIALDLSVGVSPEGPELAISAGKLL